MTVRDLIAHLQTLDQDKDVYAWEAGDLSELCHVDGTEVDTHFPNGYVLTTAMDGPEYVPDRPVSMREVQPGDFQWQPSDAFLEHNRAMSRALREAAIKPRLLVGYAYLGRTKPTP